MKSGVSKASVAWVQASNAAQRSSVELAELVSDEEVRRVADVIAASWGPQQVPQANLLRAFTHAGATVIAAEHDGRIVGCSLGFLGWNDGLHLHSHMTAVLPGWQSHGVGYALKLAQRAICLDHGVEEIRWTYDPLLSRNAHFNIVKLGAVPHRFFPDFYGAMDDSVNAGDHSDRFEVTWRLRSQRVERALAAEQVPPSSAKLVPIPHDYQALRETAPEQAREWRLRCRGQFLHHFEAGLMPVWIDERGYHFVPAQDRAAAAVATRAEMTTELR